MPQRLPNDPVIKTILSSVSVFVQKQLLLKLNKDKIDLCDLKKSVGSGVTYKTIVWFSYVSSVNKDILFFIFIWGKVSFKVWNVFLCLNVTDQGIFSAFWYLIMGGPYMMSRYSCRLFICWWSLVQRMFLTILKKDDILMDSKDVMCNKRNDVSFLTSYSWQERINSYKMLFYLLRWS